MSSAEYSGKPVDRADFSTLEIATASPFGQAILGSHYDPETMVVDGGALAVINDSLSYYPVGSDPRIKVQSFGIAKHAVELANQGLMTSRIDQVLDKSLAEAMRSSFEYGSKFSFAKLDAVMRELTPGMNRDTAPSLTALRAIIEAFGDLDGVESIDDDEGRVGRKTRRLATSQLRLAFLRQGDPEFEIPEPGEI